MSESAVNVGGTPPMAGDNAQEREARSRQADAPGNPGNAAYADPVTRIAEIRQENRGGDVSARDIEWLCDEVMRLREVIPVRDRQLAGHARLGEGIHERTAQPCARLTQVPRRAAGPILGHLPLFLAQPSRLSAKSKVPLLAS